MWIPQKALEIKKKPRYGSVMKTLSDAQLNALSKEAVIVLYQSVIEQFNALEVRDAQKQATIQRLEKKIDDLQESINVLVQQRFGRKSEKAQTDGQYSFSFDSDGSLAVALNEAEKLAECGTAEEPEENKVITYTLVISYHKRSGLSRELVLLVN